jgi:hypothetical protein
MGLGQGDGAQPARPGGGQGVGKFLGVMLFSPAPRELAQDMALVLIEVAEVVCQIVLLSLRQGFRHALSPLFTHRWNCK